MIKYSSKFSSYICYDLAHLVIWATSMSAGTGIAASRQRCAGVPTRQRRAEAMAPWGRVRFCPHARPRSRNVPNDAGRERRTRRPPPPPDDPSPTQHVRTRGPSAAPPMCLHIYLCTDHPCPAPAPARRTGGGAAPCPCRCCTAVLAIRAQIVRFSAHRIYWYRRPIDDPS